MILWLLAQARFSIQSLYSFHAKCRTVEEVNAIWEKLTAAAP